MVSGSNSLRRRGKLESQEEAREGRCQGGGVVRGRAEIRWKAHRMGMRWEVLTWMAGRVGEECVNGRWKAR